MSGKAVSGAMLTLLLIGMLTLASNIQPARSEPGTWTVDDDGPANFHTIQEAINAASDGDTIFVYNGTYYENVIVNKTISLIGENRSTTIIDGNKTRTVITITSSNASITGFTIQNGGGYDGIHLSYAENCVVAGNTLANNNVGIKVTNSDGCTVQLNNVGPNRYGIYLLYSDWCRISENVMTDNDYDGIVVTNSLRCMINGNSIVGNDFGITMYYSGNCTLRDNNMSANNVCGFAVGGDELSDFLIDADVTNTVNSKPIYYLINKHDLFINPQVFPEVGYLTLVNSTNITVQNINVTNNEGMLFAYTTNSRIENVSVRNGWSGLRLIYSNNNTISGNTAANNAMAGILIGYSNNNSISNNEVTTNFYDGIYLSHSNSNTIEDNIVISNGRGISLACSCHNTVTHNIATNNRDDNIAMYLFFSYNNILGNVAAKSDLGIYLGSYSDSNIILGNTVEENNCWGISVSDSNNNIIASNNVSQNNGGITIWHSDYNTIKNNIVTNQWCGVFTYKSNNNSIYHNNFINNTKQTSDLYHTRSVNIWDNSYPSGGNYWSDYNGTDQFSGPFQNVTSCDGIGDTPNVIDENTQDNYPLMKPWTPLIGDLNDDETVDMKDIYIVLQAFGFYPDHPRWNPDADIDKNNKVDIRDIYLVVKNFGKPARP